MKIFLSYLMVSLALVSNALAQGQSQVLYSAYPGERSVHTADGTPVAEGNTVWIGAFDPTFTVNASTANRPDLLLANWDSFGATTISRIAGEDGRFSGNSSSTDPLVANQKIYLWIFSTDDGSGPASDFANVNEYGLFSATLASWSFADPANPPPSNLRTINSNQVDQNPFGSFTSTQLLLASGWVTVPEPNTVALLSIAIPAVVLALRKRRQG